MADNAIATINKYLPYLDTVYAQSSRTAVLDLTSDLIKNTADAKTVLIPKIELTGLGNYDRSQGYPSGSETLTWESRTFAYDRGTKFTIDAMDDAETLGVAFGKLSSEFLRTKAAPEMDAIRFAKYATAAGHSATTALTAANIDDCILEGETAILEAEADLANSVFFCTPSVLKLIKQSEKFSRNLAQGENINHAIAVYDEMPIITVAQKRFYSAITLYDAKTTGQEAGGYIKDATNGKDINFMIVSRSSVNQIVKRFVMNVFAPGTNQSADGYLVNFRNYHDAWVFDNKVNGIYCHHAA